MTVNGPGTAIRERRIRRRQAGVFRVKDSKPGAFDRIMLDVLRRAMNNLLAPHRSHSATVESSQK